jgi:hypothetical protein
MFGRLFREGNMELRRLVGVDPSRLLLLMLLRFVMYKNECFGEDFVARSLP